MAKGHRRSRRGTDTKARSPHRQPAQVQPPADQEAVDGILVQIKKRELTIAGEQAGQVQKLPGYDVSVAIPEWDKNRSLLGPVRKGYLAQQKLLAKLQGTGASRAWMIQQFNAIDRTVAATLATVAERIRTRRWREKERGEALQRLQDAFRELQRWAAKATRYCERAAQCTDPAEKETVLDAACLAILKIGELVNRVERMQHGFWEEFNAAHFLEMRHMRNLIGHTDDLEGEDVIPLGTGTVQELHAAIQRTLFPHGSDPGQSGFLMSGKAIRELQPSKPGEKPTPDNSIAMILTDEHGRFVIHRAGRTESNRALISSSAKGTISLSVFAVRPNPGTAPDTPEPQG